MNSFFNSELAKELSSNDQKADLIIGNNVYAHVPNINDFTLGLKKVLKQNGVITLEFAYLYKLIEENQFDTIYHEHFSYLSLYTVLKIFEKHALKIFDVEELSTHGGSLRIYACHKDDSREISIKVNEQLKKEKEFGLFSKKSIKILQFKQIKSEMICLVFLLMLRKRCFSGWLWCSR